MKNSLFKISKKNISQIQKILKASIKEDLKALVNAVMPGLNIKHKYNNFNHTTSTMHFNKKAPDTDTTETNKETKEVKENKDEQNKKENKEEKNPENPEEDDPENKDKDPKKEPNEEEEYKYALKFTEQYYKFIKNSGQALFGFLASIALLIINWIYNQNQKTTSKEITIKDFFQNLEENKIELLRIKKDNNSSIFNVYCDLTNKRTVVLNINNNENFIIRLEQKQKELHIDRNKFVKIKYSAEANDQNKNSMTTNIFLLLVAFYCYKKMKNNLFNELTDIKYIKAFHKYLKKGKYSELMKKAEENVEAGKCDKDGTDKKNRTFKNDPFFKNMNDKLGGIFEKGKINAREYGVEEKITTKFKDVAGMESAKNEIVEFVDFLKFPEKYHKLGAKIPRGALLVGPPGTGKTLIAKSVAGEAEVPFFAISGSDFVEMFVGVGASRVRDLFKKAKAKSPSIIFIDEIDAVGKKRGGKYGGSDESDNTLNQLLVEMDGFGTEENVIILAATNRVDVLDKALLRPGRFDRQVDVNLPDRLERQDILKIYLKKVKLAKNIEITEYASRLSTLTPGYSGADLGKLLLNSILIFSSNSQSSERSSHYRC